MEEIPKKNLGLITAVYLLGIFMGALDTGIVTPARTIIQNGLLVDAKTGIWMITIYTLAYAASIPVMGKLADKFGRKYIYLASIFLFGLGSLFCGLSHDLASFPVLLISRAIQAIGGGGIMPVATAEFGTAYPKEKRGMALGLVGGVYGIANIFGASAGSAILELFGMDNWQWIFYVNVPITAFILVAGCIALPNTREKNVKPIDFTGIVILTVMMLSLLYGLRTVDFFDIKHTFASTSVYPFLLVFILMIPLFVLIENRARDPVINLRFFRNSRIVITLALSFVTGITMMGMIFVPQFSENALKIASGRGGYFVFILGLFAGLGAPTSGKLIDRFGVKIVLGFGLLASIIGAVYLIFVTTAFPSTANVVICLILTGIGMGFTMGTPLNYMMLDNTKFEESNSALATLSLIRSIGTTIAPAIMIGFIAHAGINVQTSVMSLMPKEVSIPALPYAKELKEAFPDGGMSGMSDMASMQTVKIDMNAEGGASIDPDLLELMKSSDVTTITQSAKTLADRMFSSMAPKILARTTEGIDGAIAAMGSMSARGNPGQSAPAMAGMGAAKTQMTEVIRKMTAMKEAVPGALDKAKADYLAQIEAKRPEIEKAFQDGLNAGFRQVYLTVLLSSLIGLFFLFFYRPRHVR